MAKRARLEVIKGTLLKYRGVEGGSVAVLTTYFWKWGQLTICSYCNCGTNAACNERPVICRLVSKDGREIPCLCIL
jgi:hypothetical protein